MRKTLGTAAVLALSSLAIVASPATADECNTDGRPVSGELHELEGASGPTDTVIHTVDQPICEAGL